MVSSCVTHVHAHTLAVMTCYYDNHITLPQIDQKTLTIPLSVTDID